MSAIQFILGCVSNFSSVIYGPITTNLGWKYLFHLCVLFSGLQTVLLFLFVPETQYRRDRRYEIDELVNDNLKGLAEVEKRHDNHLENSQLENTTTATSTNVEHYWLTKKTVVQKMAVFIGTYCEENLLQLLAAPFACCSNLAVLWVVVVSGILVATYVAQAYVIAQIFSFPLYNLTASGIGYLFLGPFIGGALGAVFFGCVSDPLIKYCSRKNQGVYKPEYRLIPMLGGLLAGAGLMGFGTLCQKSASYYATASLHGIALFEIVAAAIATSGYGLDAYREMSSEIFVAGIVFKNFLFYGFSYFVNS
jgi:hypothetical protein